MKKTIEFLKKKTGDFVPDIAISYSDIPNFIKSKVEGHKGRLVFAEIEGKKVVMMQGRNHFYEGYSMADVTYPVKVMKKLGVKTLILTNAAGAVNESFRPADLMIITDHINFMGTNPLIGENDDEFGERFPDMSEIYKKDLVNITEKCADKLFIQKGVYAATTGPSYETPAEIFMLRAMGADAVGMSTVPEAIIANWCGMKVLGISCISNTASGVSDTKLSHEDVIETTNRAKDRFKSLLLEILKEI